MTRSVLILSYPPLVQLREFLQAGSGLAVMAAPLLFLSLPRWVGATFLLVAALFLGHLLKTLARQMGRIELSDETLRVTGPFAASLEWRALRRLALRYYPRTRDGKSGWMRLTIQGAGRRSLSFDSDLTRFDRLLGQAVRAAVANDVAFSDATRANLAAFGQILPELPATPAVSHGTVAR